LPIVLGIFVAEFLEAYQEVIRREELLKKLTLAYYAGAFLLSIGIYFEVGVVLALSSFILLVIIWIPIKKKVAIVLSKWLREKAIKK